MGPAGEEAERGWVLSWGVSPAPRAPSLAQFWFSWRQQEPDRAPCNQNPAKLPQRIHNQRGKEAPTNLTKGLKLSLSSHSALVLVSDVFSLSI